MEREHGTLHCSYRRPLTAIRSPPPSIKFRRIPFLARNLRFPAIILGLFSADSCRSSDWTEICFSGAPMPYPEFSALLERSAVQTLPTPIIGRLSSKLGKVHNWSFMFLGSGNGVGVRTNRPIEGKCPRHACRRLVDIHQECGPRNGPYEALKRMAIQFLILEKQILRACLSMYSIILPNM
jgi:hypothetical protein